MERKWYGIRNIETGEILSETNSFTSDSRQYLKAKKKLALWLLEQFQKEKCFEVEIIEL